VSALKSIIISSEKTNRIERKGRKVKMN
jgi:hypothetical protein